MITTTNLIEFLLVQPFRFESQESTGGILNGIQKKTNAKISTRNFPEVEGVIVCPDLTSLFFREELVKCVFLWHLEP